MLPYDFKITLPLSYPPIFAASYYPPQRPGVNSAQVITAWMARGPFDPTKPRMAYLGHGSVVVALDVHYREIGPH